jgi:HEPN domain-containing protein
MSTPLQGSAGPLYPPEEWLEKAEADLDVARRIAALDRPHHDAVAFHCQQAIEKLLKAAMAARGVEPPKVHDLPELLRRAQTAGLEWSWPLTELRMLSVAAVHARYPGFGVPAETAIELLHIADRIWSSLRPLV